MYHILIVKKCLENTQKSKIVGEYKLIYNSTTQSKLYIDVISLNKVMIILYILL